jgi:hypothetical protein
VTSVAAAKKQGISVYFVNVYISILISVSFFFVIFLCANICLCVCMYIFRPQNVEIVFFVVMRAFNDIAMMHVEVGRFYEQKKTGLSVIFTSFLCPASAESSNPLVNSRVSPSPLVCIYTVMMIWYTEKKLMGAFDSSRVEC